MLIRFFVIIAPMLLLLFFLSPSQAIDMPAGQTNMYVSQVTSKFASVGNSSLRYVNPNLKDSHSIDSSKTEQPDIELNANKSSLKDAIPPAKNGTNNSESELQAPKGIKPINTAYNITNIYNIYNTYNTFITISNKTDPVFSFNNSTTEKHYPPNGDPASGGNTVYEQSNLNGGKASFDYEGVPGGTGTGAAMETGSKENSPIYDGMPG